MKTTRIRSAVLSLALMAIFASAYAGKVESGLDTVTLQLPWLHQFQFAGYYAAVEKGFYRAEGLAVVITEGRRTDLSIGRVLNGEANFGVGGTGILLNRLRGKRVVLLAAIFQHSAHAIVARRDSGIVVPADLMGRTIMWTKDRDPDFQAMFSHEGVDLTRIKIIENRWDFDDFIRGRVDAISCYITTETMKLDALGIPYSLIQPVNYGIDFYGDCLFTTEAEIAGHPTRVAAFRRASIKGWTYAMEHQDELVELIMDKYSSTRPELTRVRLRYEAEAMRHLLSSDIVEVGHVNPDRWRRIAETFANMGMIGSDYSLDGFLYDENPAPDLRWVRWLLAGVAGVLLVSGSVVLWNIKLRNTVRTRTMELERTNESLSGENAQRRRAEEMLRHSLTEKEILLKEIHHRVKNNLQIISSLLNLQADSIMDQQAREVFKESQYRVKSMALIHEKLYGSASLSRIDFGEYTRSLTASLFRSYAVNLPGVEMRVDIDSIFLGIETAIPCGLIINECMTNSCKYAFPGGRGGEILVRLKEREGSYVLTVSDSGIGFPDKLDFRSTNTLGLHLVNILTAQLGGTIRLNRESGTSFTLEFGAKNERD